jgi:hypothetical protein
MPAMPEHSFSSDNNVWLFDQQKESKGNTKALRRGIAVHKRRVTVDNAQLPLSVSMTFQPDEAPPSPLSADLIVSETGGTVEKRSKRTIKSIMTFERRKTNSALLPDKVQHKGAGILALRHFAQQVHFLGFCIKHNTVKIIIPKL